MERQACEVLIGVGIGAAILAAILLIRHLYNAERETREDDLKMALHLIKKDEERKS